MRTDGVFTLHSIKVNYKLGDVFRLIPFGDIHRDSPSCAVDKWKEFLSWAKRQKNALFFGMGDYLDSYSTSERRIIYSQDLHESTRSREEDDTMKRVAALAKEISFMRGRVVGLLGGNHFPSFGDGTTGDHRLANLLETQYLGACTATRITFTDANSGKQKRCVTLDLFAHHGRGGGQTAGGKMNAVEKLATVCEADIFLMGDNHARGGLPLGDKLRIMTHNGVTCLRTRKAWIGRTGSFLKSYEHKRASYVVDAAMQPASLGWISFILTPRRDQSDDGDRLTLDIGCEQ